ncbi:pirin family protein [Thiomonas sp.]|jgi:redox-sensitive bicupin YhaK (pirin superfamily)|uniref:pirin family protein n=1 Tax=Thiomonas sp. TaxID=2047785 RepID=UPI002614B06D|nr:pirin family protein [Thiomonas sp.]
MDQPDDSQPQILPAHEAVLGEGMRIARALPNRLRRMVGAWCFLDHFGPADVAQGQGMRVGPHPHIGLQTVTWLVQGEVLHRDSLGSLQAIRPGQLNLMTAGRGISHSEESPSPRSPSLHGAQLWIALPEAQRAREPAFQHVPDLPVVHHHGLRASVFIGEFLGQASPACVHSPLLGVELLCEGPVEAVLPLRDDFEYAVMMLEHEACFDGQALGIGSLLVLGKGRRELRVAAGAAARCLLIGGAPFGEDMRMWWNFVARTPQELRRASEDWNAGAAYFGQVHGYDGRRLEAPLPPW